jgi:hypothetical protein
MTFLGFQNFCISSGMLSKAKGQILRVGAALHILFHLCPPEELELHGEDSRGGGEIEEVDLEQEELEVGLQEKQGEADIRSRISDSAIASAINLVDVCCQHAAYMAGRQEIEEDIKIIKGCKYEHSQSIMLHDHSNTE